MNLEPKTIIQRHKEYPNATEKLIESYAFSQYRKATKDILQFAKIVEVENSDVAMIVMTKTDLKYWQDLKLSNWHLKNCIDL